MVVIRHTVLIACGTEWVPKGNLAESGQLLGGEQTGMVGGQSHR